MVDVGLLVRAYTFFDRALGMSITTNAKSPFIHIIHTGNNDHGFLFISLCKGPVSRALYNLSCITCIIVLADMCVPVKILWQIVLHLSLEFGHKLFIRLICFLFKAMHAVNRPVAVVLSINRNRFHPGTCAWTAVEITSFLRFFTSNSTFCLHFFC